MRRVLLITILVSACVIPCACTAEASPDTGGVPSLTGQWQRRDSPFPELTGMIVEVAGDQRVGIVVGVRENRYQFTVGDEKWTDIEHHQERTFTFENLVREETTGAMSTVEGEMTCPTTERFST